MVYKQMYFKMRNGASKYLIQPLHLLDIWETDLQQIENVKCLLFFQFNSLDLF